MPRQPLTVVAEVVKVLVADVRIGDRIRPVDPVWAAALGKIMAAEGQNTPIEICQLPGRNGFELIAGAHRLTGAALEGWKFIDAVVRDANAIGRRLREVSENLWRKGLDPIDRAAFVAELYDLQRSKAGVDPRATAQQIAVNARWTKAVKDEADDTSATIAHVYGFADGVAAQIGLSRRSIYNDLAVHRRLLPDVVAQLRGLSIGGNGAQLAALTKLSDSDQRQVVALIVEGKAKSVSDAHAIITQKTAPPPETKAWSAFFGGWSRMSAAKRREALRELAEQGLPKGVSISFEGAAE